MSEGLNRLQEKMSKKAFRLGEWIKLKLCESEAKSEAKSEALVILFIRNCTDNELLVYQVSISKT